MRIGQLFWAVVHEDGEIAGDGECPAISSLKPDEEEMIWLRRVNKNENLKIIRVMIVQTNAPKG